MRPAGRKQPTALRSYLTSRLTVFVLVVRVTSALKDLVDALGTYMPESRAERQQLVILLDTSAEKTF